MNNNKIIVAGIVGGIAALIIGFLVFGLALAGVLESNMGSATGVMKSEDDFLWVPMVIGHLAIGFLLAYIFGKWANISTFGTGAQAGGVIGFLMSTAYGMINYGSTNIYNLTGVIVDIVATTIVSAIIGGIVAYVLGRGK